MLVEKFLGLVFPPTNWAFEMRATGLRMIGLRTGRRKSLTAGGALEGLFHVYQLIMLQTK